MTDEVYRRRRETDRAQQRANRAADRGDHAGYLMALAQVDTARQRRDAWAKASAERQAGTA